LRASCQDEPITLVKGQTKAEHLVIFEFENSFVVLFLVVKLPDTITIEPITKNYSPILRLGLILSLDGRINVDQPEILTHKKVTMKEYLLAFSYKICI
jgi:hypothetical protein